MSATVRRLRVDDAEAVEQLLVRARAEYAAYSPRFWRPHPDAAARHTPFLSWILDQESTRALGLDDMSAALIATQRDGDWMVDDFGVADPAHWATGGRLLLDSLRAAVDDPIEVVTAEADTAKVDMLGEAGFTRHREWWIGLVDDDPIEERIDERIGASAPTNGHVVGDGATAELLDAPPVYDPGGRVAMVRNWNGEGTAMETLQRAASGRAVLLIVPVERDTPERREVLDDLGFHVASGWYRANE